MDTPLPLYHSWALIEARERFDLGHVLPVPSGAAIDDVPDPARLQGRRPGVWSFDMRSPNPAWSDTVYDLFGLPRGIPVTRAEALRIYAEDSRTAMERLRSHALRHRRGFSIDVRLTPPGAVARWVRLIAAPICRDGRVTGLHGIKMDVTDRYCRGARPL